MTGIMAYVSSPLWMAQLIVGIILVLQASYIRPEYFSSSFTLFPTWPRFDPQRSLELFALTMTILILPKFFGLALGLTQGTTRRGAGGAIKLVASVFFEIIMSALLAPIMMVIQSGRGACISCPAATPAGTRSGATTVRFPFARTSCAATARTRRDRRGEPAVAGLSMSPSLVAVDVADDRSASSCRFSLSWGSGLRCRSASPCAAPVSC
jgi:hypothetical protein